ncbi:MAG: glycosyltransferase family 2 protein [Candidatus Euphemobacter frigidus]|nr:glycosyltransferase family 2 protein [Candidatus Euphemobacter frigidus]MDP8275030.1 glycosyltransferase family 2 protein [Candidatus Euphemobacter frigidus]
MNENNSINLSVLIPLLNEKENLHPLFEKLERELKGLNLTWEVIFVDDGSTDDSLQVLKEIASLSAPIKIIRLRRNFGKSAALAAGFDLVRGEKVITMDADLQDDPEEIPVLLKKLDEGFDLISGWRMNRRDRRVKRYTSRIFNRVASMLTGIKIHDFNCGLKAFRREVVKDIIVYGELHRYIPVIAYWKGYKVGEVKVKHHPRAYGKSKFGVYRFFAGFMDMLTVMFMTKYSKKPLHLFGGVGLLLFLVGFIINAYLVVQNLIGRDFLRVRPLMFLGVLLMLVGFQLISTGLLGEMMTMSLHKRKEEYIIRETYT